MLADLQEKANYVPNRGSLPCPTGEKSVVR